jgi:ketosteroid isomerase-like protein
MTTEEATMSATTQQFDLDALRRAIESRDAAAQVAMYADDAEIVTVDKEHPPSSPQHVRGIDAIRAQIEDVCARDMTHELTRTVSGPEGAAFVLKCRYPDGTRVFCATLLELRDGKIVRQEGAQAWDEG